MADRIKGITIEIGGDTTKLNDSLKSVNKEINSTQSSLKDVERLLKLDPKNTELLAQKQQLLSQAVESTRTKLEALKDAEKQAQAQFERGEISQQQYQGLQREIIATEQRLKQLQEQAAESNVILQQISAVGGKFQEVGGAIEGVGKKLLPATAAIAGVGTASVAAAMDFEDAIAKLSTIADTSEETGVPLKQLEDQIISLSNQTGISASEIANNVYDAISAGQKTGDAVNFVSNATALAKAGFTDSAAALDILTTIMNAYGLEADEVSKVSDVLINTQNLGKTTVDQLASSMGKVIPTAKAQGVSIENLAAMYAVMTSNGIATAESTTYMNSMLSELGKQGTAAAKAFAAGTEHIKEGGLSMAEAMEMGWGLTDVLSILDEQAAASGTSISNMFGSAEAGKAAAVLWDNAQKLNDAVVQMGDSAGATQIAFDKLDTTSNKTKIALNQLQNSGVELGGTILETLMPFIIDLTGKVKDATTWFNNLDEGTRKNIVTVAAIIAALGPLLIVMGNVISSIGTIMTLLPQLSSAITAITSPIGIVSAAIIALVLLIAVKGDEIQAILQKVDDFLQGIFLKDWREVFGPGLGDALNAFFANTKNIWDSTKLIFDGIINFIRGVFTGDWQRAWTGVKEIFSGVFNSLVAIAKAPINGVIGCLNGAISGINGMIRALNNIHFEIPDWVPGLGGKSFGFNLPKIANIPLLAKGGILEAGSAIVGEKGPELLSLMNGKARVTPLTSSDGDSNAGKESGAAAGYNQTLNFYTAAMTPSEVARQTRNATRNMLAKAR